MSIDDHRKKAVNKYIRENPSFLIDAGAFGTGYKKGFMDGINHALHIIKQHNEGQHEEVDKVLKHIKIILINTQ